MAAPAESLAPGAAPSEANGPTALSASTDGSTGSQHETAESTADATALAPRAPETPESKAHQPPASALLRRGDQLVVGALALIVLALMIVHWARLSGWGLRPVEIDRLPERQFDYRIDINSATWVELMQLEEVGEVLARRIVEDRERNGPFRSIDDLRRVKGVGPKTLDTIRPWLTISFPDDQTARPM